LRLRVYSLFSPDGVFLSPCVLVSFYLTCTFESAVTNSVNRRCPGLRASKLILIITNESLYPHAAGDHKTCCEQHQEPFSRPCKIGQRQYYGFAIPKHILAIWIKTNPYPPSFRHKFISTRLRQGMQLLVVVGFTRFGSNSNGLAHVIHPSNTRNFRNEEARGKAETRITWDTAITNGHGREVIGGYGGKDNVSVGRNNSLKEEEKENH